MLEKLFCGLGIACAFPLVSLELQPNSLLNYRESVYSQCGEDGILREIFHRLGIKKGFFVDVGAFDDIYLSNVKLLHDQGWSGAFIETNVERYQKLQRNYANDNRAICIQEKVAASEDCLEGRSLDQIADEYFPNQKIDCLNIDVDGIDYFILEGLKRMPKVIVIEIGIPWHVLQKNPVPLSAATTHNLGMPLRPMIELAITKGYYPVCFTINLILVRDEYAYLFANIENDFLSLYEDMAVVFPKIFQWIQYRRKQLKEIESTLRQEEGDIFDQPFLSDK